MARSNPETTPFGNLVKRTLNEAGGTTTTNMGPLETLTGLYQYFRGFTSSVTPGWRQMGARERKKLPNLPHTVTGYQVATAAYVHEHKNMVTNGFLQTTYSICCFKQPGPPTFAHLDGAYIKARADAASKVNAMSANLAQMMGERKQTASLLADTAVRILAAARAVRRGRPGDFVAATGASYSRASRDFTRVVKTPVSKRLANHWLELQYGWKPLLQDAYGVAELLAHHTQERYVTSVVGHGREVLPYYKAEVWPDPEVIEHRETRCKVGLTYDLDSEAKAALASTGISNPALLAWELLPYSFVVDWFVPVGNYLEALNAFSGFRFIDGWISKRTRVTVNFTYSANSGVYPANGTFYRDKHSGWYAYRYWKYDRSVLYAFPGAVLPTIRNPIGGEPITRLLTATSLLRVLFK